MKEQAYRVFVDIWRLASKHQFRKMTDAEWEEFIRQGEKGLGRHKGTPVEHLYRQLFMAVQAFYKKL